MLNKRTNIAALICSMPLADSASCKTAAKVLDRWLGKERARSLKICETGGVSNPEFKGSHKCKK